MAGSAGMGDGFTHLIKSFVQEYKLATVLASFFIPIMAVEFQRLIDEPFDLIASVITE